MVFLIDGGVTPQKQQSKPKPRASTGTHNVRFGNFVDDIGRVPIRPSRPPTPSPRTKTPSYSVGSRGGGGGGGGGGGSSTPAPPTNPLAGLDLDEIRAALDAISGMFELQRGNLSVEQENALNAFNMLKERINLAQTAAVDQARSSAAGRGLLRSGLYLNTVADIGEEAADQLTQATAERAARQRAIQQQIAGLTAQEKAERMARARQLAREQVGTKEAIAAALELV